MLFFGILSFPIWNNAIAKIGCQEKKISFALPFPYGNKQSKSSRSGLTSKKQNLNTTNASKTLHNLQRRLQQPRAPMIKCRRIVFCLIAFFLINPCSYSLEVNTEHYSSSVFTVIRIDLRQDELRLFWLDESKKPFSAFSDLAEWLQSQHQQLAFAMNAGMFEKDYSPVGLFVSQGEQQSPINLSSGKGNFFLKPNGIFLISEKGARIIESEEYEGLKEQIILATQSGPLLVRHGAIHSAFNPNSSSKLIRNGVGMTNKGEVVFVISETPVNFYQFASFFRDALHCADALYFDGTVSSLYAPQIGRNDAKAWLGPIIGVVKQGR